MTQIEKIQKYLKLIKLRKGCTDCADLINPSRWEKEGYDSLQIGPWSRWQGNLDTQLMVVGQDWGTPAYFTKWKGFDDPRNPTNLNLRDMLMSIGFNIKPFNCKEHIGDLFFTNAILCLKHGTLQSKVKNEWVNNCGRKFLKPLIEMIRPKVLIALGEKAFNSVSGIFGISYKRQKTYGLLVDTIGESGGLDVQNGTHLFPVYHCGTRIINTKTRSRKEQLNDWKPIGKLLG